MTNYNNSKKYKIEPIIEHEPNEIYVGNTTKERLCQRMTYHRSAYNIIKKVQSTSGEILSNAYKNSSLKWIL